MAFTVNHVVVPNFAPVSITNVFNQMWKLTRAMKKAGWKYLASGDGTTKHTGGNPAGDLWATTPGTVGFTTNAGAAAASIAAPTRGRATVTGLTGIVSADKGRFLVISGAATGANNNAHQIEEIVSATSVRIDARQFAVVSDANNGSLTWLIKDANNASETYPATLNTVAAWWCARGPSTLKIPITSAPVGTFLRGENLTEATTGAEGELVGYVFDSGVGYLVVAPRLRGTGADPYGWGTGNVVTGSLSLATVTQVGTALEYRHEVVIWKDTDQIDGSIFVSGFEPVAEGALNSFGTLAASAGCTATIAPGGGGTGNAFPSFAWVQWGTGTTGGALHEEWRAHSVAIDIGNAQIMCVDAIEEEDYSADASWFIAMAITAFVGEHVGYGFQRVDDTEDGDLDPYVTFIYEGNVGTSLYTNERTNAGGPSTIDGGSGPGLHTAHERLMGTGGYSWRGWRRRGLSGDAATGSQDFEMFFDSALQSAIVITTTGVMELTGASPAIVATAPVATKVREPIRIGSVQSARRMHKGSCRWMSLAQGGVGTDTYDSKRFVQFSSVTGRFVIGPWDGTTTPTTT
jgi:hypothetical protein